jgi:hypothetical protein
VIRGSVPLTNDIVLELWAKMGAVDTGSRRPYTAGEVLSEAIIFAKILVR